MAEHNIPGDPVRDAQCELQNPQPSVIQPSASAQGSDGTSVPNLPKPFCVKVAETFFQNLNANNPHINLPNNFGTHYFTDDVSMRLICVTPEIYDDVFEGSLLVCEKFAMLVKQELLKFAPIHIKGSEHDLQSPTSIVQVFGLVKKGSETIGIFNQMMLLKSLPSSSDFKISVVNMKIECKAVETLPGDINAEEMRMMSGIWRKVCRANNHISPGDHILPLIFNFLIFLYL